MLRDISECSGHGVHSNCKTHPLMNAIFQGLKLPPDKLPDKTSSLSSFLVNITKCDAPVNLLLNNTDEENKIILLSDTSLSDWEILDQYKKKNYIKSYLRPSAYLWSQGTGLLYQSSEAFRSCPARLNCLDVRQFLLL